MRNEGEDAGHREKRVELYGRAGVERSLEVVQRWIVVVALWHPAESRKEREDKAQTWLEYEHERRDVGCWKAELLVHGSRWWCGTA